MKDIFEKNEANANKSVAKVMVSTILIFAVILILDLLEIFIIKKSVMVTVFCVNTVLLLIPTLFNKIFGPEKTWLKYVYINIASLFILLLSTTLTYHIVLIYSYPIAIACLYFDSKTVRISIILTIVVTILGQFLGYYFNFNVDRNFFTLKRLILFSILPRLFTLSCFASILLYLTKHHINNQPYNYLPPTQFLHNPPIIIFLLLGTVPIGLSLSTTVSCVILKSPISPFIKSLNPFVESTRV